MKATKIVMNVLLLAAVVVMGYFCVMSVVTPIQFEETRAKREVSVVQNLIHLRTAEAEFKNQHGRFTADLDSLVLFLRTAPKKEVLKEGSLTEKQLEAGLTEHKAVKIIELAKVKAQRSKKFENDDELYAYIWENDRDIKDNGLKGFRRDTINTNMIESLYKGAFNEETIEQIIYIPFSNGLKYEAEVNDNYKTSQGIHVPLVEIRASFKSYLGDLNLQELANLEDKESKMDHYTGLKIGDVMAPNNNAGNWE